MPLCDIASLHAAMLAAADSYSATACDVGRFAFAR
jgi:hypothetical protein